MASSFIPKNILLVGATGWLGSIIAKEVIKRTEFSVRILARKDTLAAKKDLLDSFRAAGATIVEGDVSDPASLSSALQGVDTVLSTVSGPALVQGDQSKLLQAAKAAGVKYFIPSEFGIEPPETDPILGGKTKFHAEIEASGLHWTYIITGPFYQYFFSPAARFDAKNGKATVPGDGTARFSTIDIHDIGKYVPDILLDSETKNKTVTIAGATLTFNEAIKVFEDALGKKFQVTHLSGEENQKIFETDENFMEKLISRLHIAILTTKQDHTNQGAKYTNIHPTTLADFAKASF